MEFNKREVADRKVPKITATKVEVMEADVANAELVDVPAMGAEVEVEVEVEVKVEVGVEVELAIDGAAVPSNPVANTKVPLSSADVGIMVASPVES